jgi:ubiquinone/menaquinone biosynthesis C-methylase UbiE
LLDEIGPEGNLVGLDSSPHMLALAARRCQDHDNVEFHEADPTSLPVGDAGFDAALCVQVLEYVPDVSPGLAELRRALGPGGRVVVWNVDWATVSWHSGHRARIERLG